MEKYNQPEVKFHFAVLFCAVTVMNDWQMFAA